MSFSRLYVLAALIAIGCGGGGSSPTSPTTTGNNNNNNNGNNNNPQVGSLKGTVVDQAGSGVAGASVQIAATGQTSQSTSSAADGSYSFSSLAVGAWTVTVSPPSGYTGGGSASVSITANAQTTASPFTLSKAAVTGNAPTQVDVIVYESAFTPTDITVAKNGTVRWTNQDAIQHTATGQSFDTGPLNAGQSKSVTFPQTGTFNYVCSLHPGMRGTITVQ